MDANKSLQRDYLDLKGIQQASFELLCEFCELCDKAGLRYDLCGGTLLGAVRHKGFIPWDDDADVSLPRPDYERFLQMIESGEIELPPDRGIVSVRDGSFTRHFFRYVNYKLHRESSYALDEDCPYFALDVFAIDGISSSRLAFWWQTVRIEVLRRTMLIALSQPGTSRRGKLGTALKDIARPFARAIGAQRLAKRLEQICMSHNFETSTYVALLNGLYGTRQGWSKEDFLPQTLLEFEGRMFKGYKNYDIHLSNLFGNYMQLPPEDKRHVHYDKVYRIG